MPPLEALFPHRLPSANPTQLVNWAHNATLGANRSLHSVTDESQLQALVAAAPGRVRACANRMSPGWMLALESRNDFLVDISALSGLLEADENSATFGGGTPLHGVFEVLTAMGRMLNASPGVIAVQSLAGAISTGTHGQGLGQSSLADEALSIRFVDADGNLQQWERAHPQFAALQLGLGALGIITAVTLRTRPAATFTCFKDACAADNLADDLLNWNPAWTLSKAWWFPDENKVHVWNAREATPNEHQQWVANQRELVVQSSGNSAMNYTVDNTLVQMRHDARIVDDNGKPFRTVTRFKDFSDVTGDIYQVFCRSIATAQINVEIGIPLAKAA